jgi:hypothetical protein
MKKCNIPYAPLTPARVDSILKTLWTWTITIFATLENTVFSTLDEIKFLLTQIKNKQISFIHLLNLFQQTKSKVQWNLLLSLYISSIISRYDSEHRFKNKGCFLQITFKFLRYSFITHFKNVCLKMQLFQI